MYRIFSLRSLLMAFFTTSIVSLSPVCADEADAEKKPAVVIVHLPAEAELIIAGIKSKQKTPVREFDTPPLTPGKKFSYRVQATWKDGDKEVNHETTVVVRAGETSEVNLLEPKPLPHVAEKIAPPEEMPVMEDKPEPPSKPQPKPETKPETKLKPEPKPEPEKKPEPKPEPEKKPEPKPEPEMKPEPEKKLEPEKKPEPLRKPPTPKGTLTLYLPDTLTLAPGGSKLLPIRIVRQQCEGPVHLSFEGLPSGVSLKETTLAAEKQKVYVHAGASSVAEKTETEIKVIAVSGSVRQESVMKIKIAK